MAANRGIATTGSPDPVCAPDSGWHARTNGMGVVVAADRALRASGRAMRSGPAIKTQVSPRTLAALLTCVSITCATTLLRAQTPEVLNSTVGMPVEIPDLVLPGSELEPIPITDETPVVVRIDAVYPHGDSFRYDLVCYTLEPGGFDLRDFLRRKDGTGTDDLPVMLLHSETLLPPGQIEPHGLQSGTLPWLGGYRLLLVLGGLVWVAGLVWILYPRRKAALAGTAASTEPVSLADRLQPLVTDAVEGRADPARLAELERALVRYWRRRLQLEEMTAAEALIRLGQHAEAGALLTQLEAWLHRPGMDQAIDVNALLSPYRNVSPDDLPLRADSAEAGGAAVPVAEGRAR